MTSGERVLVTGGSGRLGRAVIQELLAHDYDAIAADRVRPPGGDVHGVRVIETDLGDVGQVAGAMRGCAAVIHLGAIPAPYAHPDEVVFRNNTGATFAVLQAASLLGIRRAAIASSVSAYGTAWARHRFAPAYVPVDEAHPMLNHDAYGLSKEVDERTAEMFCRRDGMSIAALRFHWIATQEEQRAAVPGNRDRDAQLEGTRGFWGYVDVRDAARACRLAIEVGRDRPFGFEPFNIIAADTLMDAPTEPTIRELAPETEIRAPIPGNTSAWDTGKAKRILGWEPEHSWRDEVRSS
jgi:nucleoside-diphosphate-sugar epimerase